MSAPAEARPVAATRAEVPAAQQTPVAPAVPAASGGWEPMTLWRLLPILRRRWYVTVLGALLTVWGIYGAASAPGVYYEQAYIVFLAPNLPPRTNAYQLVPDSLIAAAGLVGRQVHADTDTPLPVSSTVDIVDLGFRDGVLVRIPRSGGQWTTNFGRPVLDIQIVGHDRQQVRARLTAIVSTIRRTLREGQLAFGAPSDSLIRTALNPPTPPVLYRRDNPARAGAAALVLGMGLTSAAAVVLDAAMLGLTRRRRLRRDRR